MNDSTETQDDLQLPPKPEPPLPGECCESGCDPCVFDYYYEALRQWEAKVAEIKARGKT